MNKIVKSVYIQLKFYDDKIEYMLIKLNINYLVLIVMYISFNCYVCKTFLYMFAGKWIKETFT